MSKHFAQPDDLKKIVDETIGSTASHLLLNRIYALLAKSQDLHTTAVEIEQMVGLFVGHATANSLKQKFQQILQ